MPKSARILIFLITLHIAISILTILVTGWWVLEISLNAGAYHLFLHLIELAALMISRQGLSLQIFRMASIPLVLLCIAYVRPMIPFYLPAPAAEAGDSFRVLSMNVELGCCDASKVAEYVREYNPDLLVIFEGGADFFDALPLANDYAYVREVRRADPFALAVYSHAPIEWDNLAFEEPELPPVLFGSFQSKSGQSVRLGVFHALPPLSQKSLHTNSLLIRRITNRVRHLPGPTLLIGDLNATPFSRLYQRLVVNGDLIDAFHGRGWYASWSARNRLLRFPTDHLWIKGGIEVHAARVLPGIGSDHFPLFVETQM